MTGSLWQPKQEFESGPLVRLNGGLTPFLRLVGMIACVAFGRPAPSTVVNFALNSSRPRSMSAGRADGPAAAIASKSRWEPGGKDALVPACARCGADRAERRRRAQSDRHAQKPLHGPPVALCRRARPAPRSDHHSHVGGERRKRRKHWPFGALTVSARLTIVPPRRLSGFGWRGARFLASPPGPWIIREETMKSLKNLAIGAALLASASVVSFAAMAKDLTVGVSWSNFQEERWKTDEAAIKKALDGARRQVHLGRRARVADQAADRRREPHLQGRQRAHHPRHGLRRRSFRRSRRRATKAFRSSPTTA